MNTKHADYSARANRDLVRLATWTGVWLATLALASFGPSFLWQAGSISFLAILLNLAAGIAMIWANIGYVKGLDELMQRIQLEAMGISLGVAVVGGLSLSLLDLTDVVAFKVDIGHLVFLIGITYLATTVIGNRRYR